jgi:hypothetical protein
MSPLDYILAVKRDEGAEPARRDGMAKVAAHYCHAKLSSAEHPGKGDEESAAATVPDLELARWLADKLLTAAKR